MRAHACAQAVSLAAGRRGPAPAAAYLCTCMRSGFESAACMCRGPKRGVSQVLSTRFKHSRREELSRGKYIHAAAAGRAHR
jgi:hypothetical protein